MPELPKPPHAQISQRTLFHDLRVGIGIASGQLDTLQLLMEEGNQRELQKRLPVALRSSRRALQRLQDMVDDAQNRVMKLVEPSELGRHVHSISEKVIADLSDDGPLALDIHAVDLDAGKRPELVLYNRACWRRILQNIVANAQRAEAEKLDVMIQRKGERSEPGIIQVTFEDDGKGFPKSVLRKLREGKQVTTKSVEDGPEEHGLGVLSIREQVEALRGTLEIGNRNKKDGARLRFTFPAEIRNGKKH